MCISMLPRLEKTPAAFIAGRRCRFPGEVLGLDLAKHGLGCRMHAMQQWWKAVPRIKRVR